MFSIKDVDKYHRKHRRFTKTSNFLQALENDKFKQTSNSFNKVLYNVNFYTQQNRVIYLFINFCGSFKNLMQEIQKKKYNLKIDLYS